MKKILLGYELKTGKEVHIKPSHLIVTGITQLSGKSTTLEGLIKRSGLKAIVFKTKVGEKVFTEGTLIPPYFKERSDWQFVQSLLEAALKEKLKFERSWIIRASKGTQSLFEVRARIDEFLAKEKLRAMDRDMFTNLAAYLDLILPELRYTNFSKTLNLSEGMNIIDLEKFRIEVQHLVISSVMEEVLNNQKDTIVVMPEAWKHLPQGRGTPCKLAAVSFIRQGATNNNYLWIDSQDITGVDKEPLKQVSIWIMGLQTEKNEVIRTLDQVPLPKKSKPKPAEIMTLERGHFYLCTPEMTKKVYVQPAWLSSKVAKKVALGKKSVDDIVQPQKLVPLTILPKEEIAYPVPHFQKQFAKVNEDIVEIRNDFFNKVQEIREYVNKIGLEVMRLKELVPNEDIIVSKVLQKLPVQQPISVDEEVIIQKVLSRVPKVSGMITYEVAPLEKIQKDFLEEAKNKVLNDVKNLDDEQKKILKFIETQGKGCNQTYIISRCLFLSATSGGTRQRVSKKCREMATEGVQLIRMDKNAICYPNLKERIKELLKMHNASDQEIQQVYDYILMELLK